TRSCYMQGGGLEGVNSGVSRLLGNGGRNRSKGNGNVSHRTRSRKAGCGIAHHQRVIAGIRKSRTRERENIAIAVGIRIRCAVLQPLISEVTQALAICHGRHASGHTHKVAEAFRLVNNVGATGVRLQTLVAASSKVVAVAILLIVQKKLPKLEAWRVPKDWRICCVPVTVSPDVTEASPDERGFSQSWESWLIGS